MPTKIRPKACLRGSVSLNTELGEFLNERRISLLEAIDAHGTLLHAARTLPLSYKAAWDALECMNRLAGKPLVERVAGGRRGGGTVLTDDGRRLVAMYRAVEKECQMALHELLRHMESGADAVSFRYLLRRGHWPVVRPQLSGPPGPHTHRNFAEDPGC